MSPQQKALVLPRKQGGFELSSRSIPNPGAGELLVKIQSAALNPFDYKITNTDYTHYPAVLGMDIAGIVEELGEGVHNFRRGDRVLDNSFPRLAHGKFTNDFTAFQQYALTVASFTAKIPASESFDSAATVPLALDTAVVGLYGDQFGARITPPWEEGAGDHESKKPIVILGGSSSVGAYTIQLARLSGFYPIITTASPSNEELVKGYGATHFFDRNLSGKQLLAAINEVTDDPIKLVYDAISLPETQAVAWELLANNGTLVLTLPASVKEDEGKGRRVVPTLSYPHTPENEELCSSSWAMVEKWLSDGTIKPNKYEVLPNGLEGVIGGLERMKLGQVSGTKLVAHPQETQ
ncbi:chaperonin 10-like protein [Suillus fuscotomentosus]|uniref:Chaperonin 10-like protein n=1 Tax=Suillus fuscotomentosus TaxID=1912939 RepID=A0AAD4EG01_9AGAM|nr:chaperonin 10-like protein [Suillus fuscotomentosus]KAG1905559.1 chaperonin 10-like protein [Suillus fuscotomentosus]